MEFFRFLFSKKFVYQILLALIIVTLLCFCALKWLNFSTNHDQRIEVPKLGKLSFDKTNELLKEKNLIAQVQDSANFNPLFPPFSVIEQNPKAGSFVKENRKIYLVLNPSGYRKISIPNVIQKTKRQAKPTLQALGFRIGEINYKPNIAKDMVLELKHKGKTIKPGDMLMKTSVIDLIIGDGTH